MADESQTLAAGPYMVHMDPAYVLPVTLGLGTALLLLYLSTLWLAKVCLHQRSVLLIQLLVTFGDLLCGLIPMLIVCYLSIHILGPEAGGAETGVGAPDSGVGSPKVFYNTSVSLLGFLILLPVVIFRHTLQIVFYTERALPTQPSFLLKLVFLPLLLSVGVLVVDSMMDSPTIVIRQMCVDPDVIQFGYIVLFLVGIVLYAAWDYMALRYFKPLGEARRPWRRPGADLTLSVCRHQGPDLALTLDQHRDPDLALPLDQHRGQTREGGVERHTAGLKQNLGDPERYFTPHHFEARTNAQGALYKLIVSSLVAVALTVTLLSDDCVDIVKYLLVVSRIALLMVFSLFVLLYYISVDLY